MYLSEQAARESAKTIVAFKRDSSAPITEADLEKAFVEGVKWERERMIQIIDSITSAQNAAIAINNSMRTAVGLPIIEPVFK